jgi:hypothetical protein
MAGFQLRLETRSKKLESLNAKKKNYEKARRRTHRKI